MMLTVFIIAVLLYVVSVASYVLWIHIEKEQKKGTDKSQLPPDVPSPPENDIIGKSLFRLPSMSIPEPSPAKAAPMAARTEETEKEADKSDNFVSSKPEGSVPEQEEEPDDTAGNPPLAIEEELEYEKPEDEEDQDEDESEEVAGLRGASIASGVSFEDMGQAVTVVVHHPQATPEECRKAGKTLSRLENTGLFETLAASVPDRRDIISELMDLHLKDYLAGSTGRKNRNPGQVPEGFDINDLVQQINK